MDVFPELIGEKELSYYTPSDYLALRGVLNDVLARDVVAYTKNPLANPGVVKAIEENLGSALESLTMHFTLMENGTFDLVKSLVPETLATASVDYDDLIERLTFLEENANKLLTVIPGRKRIDYDKFRASIAAVVERIRQAGDTPTYPDLLQRVDENSFVFYVPNEKDHSTFSGVINQRKRQWTTVLQGARYIKRCNEEKVSYPDRRRF